MESSSDESMLDMGDNQYQEEKQGAEQRKEKEQVISNNAKEKMTKRLLKQRKSQRLKVKTDGWKTRGKPA